MVDTMTVSMSKTDIEDFVSETTEIDDAIKSSIIRELKEMGVYQAVDLLFIDITKPPEGLTKGYESIIKILQDKLIPFLNNTEKEIYKQELINKARAEGASTELIATAEDANDVVDIIYLMTRVPGGAEALKGKNAAASRAEQAQAEGVEGGGKRRRKSKKKKKSKKRKYKRRSKKSKTRRKR
tara:strand:+ start:743 stop:1291 length:549 start_codon:yes stop_codon:yes gene_type:complete